MTWDEVSKEMQSKGTPLSVLGYCRIAFDLAKGNSVWTSSLPTKEGWYWLRWGGGHVVLKVMNGCIYDGVTDENVPVERWKGEWYGPIEPPEYP